MKRMVILLVFLVVAVCTISGQGLDYRQVIFGNSYEQIKQIDADAFFNQYPQAKQAKEYGKGPVSWYDTIYYRVYEQRMENATFYRIISSLEILSDDRLTDWKNADTWFDQQLLYKINEKELQYMGTYTFNGSIATQYDTFPYYENVEIIHRKNKVKGILSYKVEFYKRREYEETLHSGEYVLFEQEVRTGGEIVPGLKGTENKNRISIEASEPLIDERRPFMYTIQNAFDGNPATSYVEDTEDDLFFINLKFKNSLYISSFSLINGYAANSSLFFSNGRIDTIYLNFALKTTNDSDWDYLMDYAKNIKISDISHYQQFNFNLLQFSKIGIASKTVIKGDKYQDTCISELNFYTDEYGWLFGDSYE